jgi:hypothetical protein
LYQTVELLLIFHQLGENVKILLVCLWLFSVKINRKRVVGERKGGGGSDQLELQSHYPHPQEFHSFDIDADGPSAQTPEHHDA